MPICHKNFKKILNSHLHLPWGKVLLHPFISFLLLIEEQVCLLQWELCSLLTAGTVSAQKAEVYEHVLKTWIEKQFENDKCTPPQCTRSHIHNHTQHTHTHMLRNLWRRIPWTPVQKWIARIKEMMPLRPFLEALSFGQGQFLALTPLP